MSACRKDCRVRHTLSEIGCKGTTKNANTQIFLEKNVFLYKKSVYLQHLANVASGELLKNVVLRVTSKPHF
jgi:hypothetical protein